MNWPLAISRNRTALLAIAAAIVALIGGRVLLPFDRLRAQDEGGTIARSLRNAALALLRPAEAAARRLIVIAARGLTVAPRPAPAFSGGPGPRRDKQPSAGARPPAFRLFDRRKRFVRLFRPLVPAGTPRIRTFWGPPAPPPIPRPFDRLRAQDEVGGRPDPDAPVDATGLRLRLSALERALADLPRQARRLARWRARRLPGPGGRPGSPLRLGHPPGWRSRPGREIDDVLKDCHGLALEALALDTS